MHKFVVFPHRVTCGLIVAASASLSVQPIQAQQLGTNPDGITYYSTTAMFANSMKAADTWLTANADGSGPWDTGKRNAIPGNRSDGYPSYVPFTPSGSPSQVVHTQLPVFENGTHKLIVTGKGKIRYSAPGASAEVTLTGGTKTVDVNISGANNLADFDGSGIPQRKQPSKVLLRILESNNQDPVRDIRFMRPGYHTASRDAFDNDFIAAHSAFSNGKRVYDHIRYMDLQRTNWSYIQNSSHLIGKDFYTQADFRRGISLDHIVDLAIATNTHTWICIPHQMDDAGVDAMARKMRNLGSGRWLFVEYTNEHWNSGFANGRFPGHPESSGQYDWIDRYPGQNKPQKYAYRANQVFSRFETAMAGSGVNVRFVIAGQAANKWFLENAIPIATKASRIAIAPYFGTTFSTLPNPIPTLDQLASSTWNKMTDVVNRIREHKTLANNKGKILVCYEGGQHYVGGTPAIKDNNTLTGRLLDLNRDWRMANLYRWSYLPAIKTEGVSAFLHFTTSSQFTKHGSWGAREWMKQTVNGTNGNAVKENAIREWRGAN